MLDRAIGQTQGITRLTARNLQAFSDGVQHKVDTNQVSQAIDAMGLDTLRESFAPPVIALCYENDQGYCAPFLSHNGPALSNFIFLVDGIPTAASSYHMLAIHLPPGLERIQPGQVAGLRQPPSTQRFTELSYFASLLKKLSAQKQQKQQKQPDRDDTKAHLKQALAEVKLLLGLLAMDAPLPEAAALAGKLGIAAESALKNGDKSAQFSADLDRLAGMLLPKTPAQREQSIREQLSPETQRARAEQISRLAAQNPGKTLVVMAGAVSALDTQNPKTQEKHTGFLSFLENGNSIALPLVLTRTGAVGDPMVRYDRMTMSIGEDKLQTSQQAILANHALFKAKPGE